MFKNFLLVAFRNFRRNRFFTIINILGLALGMAVALLIMEFVIRELSFDRFHQNKDSIYRVIISEEKEGAFSPTAYITAAVAPSMAEEFPEVEGFVRFMNPSDAYLTFGDKNIHVENLTYADSSIFSIFSFDLLKGLPEDVLNEPYKVVLTKSTAQKMFGDDVPLGQVIRLNGKDNLVVSGIMDDVPNNSHLQFGALVSFSTLYLDKNLYLDWNGGWNYLSYVILHPGSDLDRFKAKFPDFMEKNINYLYRQHGFVLHLKLQPLIRIHLFSGKDFNLEGEGDLSGIFIFSSIAIFILLIACINFMNLTTARSFSRAREIGMRKVAGATRPVIIMQFLFETLLLSTIAFFISILLLDTLQGAFNRMISADLDFLSGSFAVMLGGMALLVILTGLISGIYPAWFVSRFQPLTSIKGTFISGRGKASLRNILVVFQFTISVVLIILTLVVYRQMDYISTKPAGFNKENVLVIPMISDKAMGNYQAIKNAFGQVPQVSGIGASSEVPGNGFTMNGYLPEGFKEPVMINVLDIDAGYLNVMEIPVIQGRGFDPATNADSAAFLVNESLAKKLGWENPVGKKIFREGAHEVIGVVSDFHFASLHQPIQPLIITKQPWLGYSYISVRVQPGTDAIAVKSLETAWASALPDEPFDHFSMEQYMQNAYTGLRNTRDAFIWCAGLAVFIAALGLLGLATFTSNQRRKEIGIRKVLGAGTSQVARKLTYDFLKLVMLAGIIGLPISYYLMGKWMENFAYRAYIGYWIFILPILIVTILAWITIYFQVKVLANTNPSDVLKFE